MNLTEVLSERIRAAVEHALQPGELVDFVAPAVGSGLVLTDRRLIVVHVGASLRSEAEILGFVLDRKLDFRLNSFVKGVTVRSSEATINLWLHSDQFGQAEALLAELRTRINAEGA